MNHCVCGSGHSVRLIFISKLTVNYCLFLCISPVMDRVYLTSHLKWTEYLKNLSENFLRTILKLKK